MNFKPELLTKVLASQKTQTRRPVKSGQELIIDYGNGDCVIDAKGCTVYHVGRDYAACPGRGKYQQGRIALTWIRREDVRQISYDDICAEGFSAFSEFISVWAGFYDKPATRIIQRIGWSKEGDVEQVMELLNARPDHLYQAWALTFALVERMTDAPSR